MSLVLASSTAPSVAALAQVLFAAFDGSAIETRAGRPWPFAPDSLDFSAVGNITIAIEGASALVTFSFALAGSPKLVATLDLAKLEAQLVTAPNVFSNDSGSLGPSASLRWDSPAVTRQRSGIMFVTGGWNGTQSAQDIVAVTLYRDYGMPGQVQLDTWDLAPGGLGTFNWAGHHHALDTLPDGAAHTYTTIATGSGGSLLTATADFDVFEIGPPG